MCWSGKPSRGVLTTGWPSAVCSGSGSCKAKHDHWPTVATTIATNVRRLLLCRLLSSERLRPDVYRTNSLALTHRGHGRAICDLAARRLTWHCGVAIFSHGARGGRGGGWSTQELVHLLFGREPPCRLPESVRMAPAQRCFTPDQSSSSSRPIWRTPRADDVTNPARVAGDRGVHLVRTALVARYFKSTPQLCHAHCSAGEILTLTLLAKVGAHVRIGLVTARVLKPFSASCAAGTMSGRTAHGTITINDRAILYHQIISRL